MSLSVNNPEAGKLAQTLAERLGETVEEAVVRSLRERLERTTERATSRGRRGQLLALGKECANLPDYDIRSADEILGYDENGLPN